MEHGKINGRTVEDLTSADEARGHSLCLFAYSNLQCSTGPPLLSQHLVCVGCYRSVSLVKVLSQEPRSLGFVMHIQKWNNGVPTMKAMSGTPISIGPVDIKGPLICLQGTHLESLSNPNSFPLAKLDEMDTMFNNLLQDDPKSTTRTELTSEFPALLAMRQLSVAY